MDAPALGVSGIPASWGARGLPRVLPRVAGLQLGLSSELLCLASAEEFERGLDAFVLAGVGVGEELVDLEPTDLFADHVSDGGKTLGMVSLAMGVPSGRTIVRCTIMTPPPSGPPLGGRPKPWLSIISTAFARAVQSG